MNTEELYEQVDEILESYNIIYTADDIEELTLPDFFQGMHDIFVSRITAPFALLGIITVIVIFTALVKNVTSVMPQKSDIADIAGTLTAIAVLISPVLTLYSEICDTIIRCGEFIEIFVPVFSGVCAVSGNISALGTYNLITLGMSQIVVWISSEFLMPVLSSITALSVTGSIYCSKSADSIAKLAGGFIKWTLTACTGILVGFMTLKGSIGASADTFATKTAKFIISGCVPIIGGAVSDAYSTVKGSLGILKGTAGTAGIVTLLFIFAPPVIEIVAFRAVIKIGAFLSDMFSSDTVGKLLKGFESGLSTALSIIICFSVIFIISTAILMKANTV